MWESILMWFANLILNYLFKKGADALDEHQKDLEHESRLNIVNDANVKAFIEAKDRNDRVQKALALLNRT